MLSLSRRLLAVVLLFSSVALAQSGGDAALSSSERLLEDVLAATQVRAVLEGSGESVLLVLQEYDVIPSERVRELVYRHYADSTLYRYVLEAMEEQADDDLIGELSSWLLDDWAVSLRERVDSYEPPLTMLEYSQQLEANPPPEDRLRLLGRFVDANAAAAFYLGLDAARRQVLRDVGSALGAEELKAIPEPALEELQDLAYRYTISVVVSFLWRYAVLEDAEIERLADAYESESGRWYVETYSLAVADALRRAGQEVAMELSGGALPIFRYADFGPGLRVVLGEPFPSHPDVVERGDVMLEEPGVYSLDFVYPFPTGDVPITVTIQTTPDGMAMSLRFDYGEGYDFDAERADYEETLGEPAQREASDEGKTEVWEDGETRFLLTCERTDDGDEQCYSVLTDKNARL